MLYDWLQFVLVYSKFSPRNFLYATIRERERGRGRGGSGHVRVKKYVVLIGKLEGGGEVLGRSTHGWEDNIKIGLKDLDVNL